MYFENGLKFVTVHGLHYASVCRPSAAEVWFFTLAGEDTRMETNKSLLRSSDRVRVLAGVDVGKTGVVIAKDGANDEAVEVDVQEDTIRLYNVAYVERVTAASKLCYYKYSKCCNKSTTICVNFAAIAVSLIIYICTVMLQLL